MDITLITQTIRVTLQNAGSSNQSRDARYAVVAGGRARLPVNSILIVTSRCWQHSSGRSPSAAHRVIILAAYGAMVRGGG